jgi:hypothetical protein
MPGIFIQIRNAGKNYRFFIPNLSPVNLIPDRGYLEVIPFLEEGIPPFH